jgi:hypothetical protein
VAVAVDENDVARTAQTADDREIRLVAGAEDQGVAFPEPFGKTPLEILMQLERPVRRARAGGPGTVLGGGTLHGGHDLRV